MPFIHRKLTDGPSRLEPCYAIMTNSSLRATLMHAPLSQVRETCHSRSPEADACVDMNILSYSFKATAWFSYRYGVNSSYLGYALH